ncbi:hypothetical protein OIDMADRAFT_22130 [Oidiodendron maius Zn]|uniref:Pinin/SDK/MemA protein domain-containing protein n=1 Tax=Oidiodendron maius (strain Zn) TaxID=913774 RepID=A0A0C3HWE5_OIDMZ|nr:hypothetical protein OIDMADRAFT_22130 [Oidiodendron maius Zn]
MSGSIGPISSAVIVPEPSGQSPPRKRRQSSLSNASPKRPRLSHDGSTGPPSTLGALPQVDAATPEPATVPDDEKERDLTLERRKSSVQEERKRSRRLFGGILSALSQTAPSGQQKRRQEIEKRQAEKAKQQKVNDEDQRAERLARLKATRKAEQIKYNRESMRSRHSNILSRANFLSTRTEPKLYYKPWELLPEEEDRIKRQISEVEILIEREVEEFNTLYPYEPVKDALVPEEKQNNSSKETVGEPRTESPPNSNIQVDPTNPPTQTPQSNQPATGRHSLEEHNGEVVVEADEDTVIY